ncbi:hypothetical protein IFM89_018159 [Coptis chinensis]|uniref:Sulfite exporter TauE/SafE family protein n=1 Tax=Coptis chinensis TaxID=261450 RepID=A0A835I369_9MAGN|nr:hypothetical protein IFM89_018159 [Coptis chinensis]
MAKRGAIWSGIRSVVNIAFLFLAAAFLVSAERRSLKHFEDSKQIIEKKDYFLNVVNFLWRSDQTGYQHVWPIVVGSIVGFCGAAFGSVGGVGGGGIFVPMLTLIIGFDPKSSTAISKCMIMGAAGSTVYYNLKLRHPTLELLIIDYNLALLFQPMLMLGISIGVAFNVVFADWMVTVLLIILFRGTSTKAFFKGVETWKKETILKKEAAKRLESNGTSVSSATTTFAMTFSSSMSVVEYYLLKCFPVPYGVSSQEDCAIKIRNLESKLDSIVCTIKDRKELEKHIPTPSEVVVEYDKAASLWSLHEQLKQMEKEVEEAAQLSSRRSKWQFMGLEMMDLKKSYALFMVAHSFLAALQNDERANYQLDAKFQESYLKKVVSLLQCQLSEGAVSGKDVNHIEVENGIDQRDGVVDEIEEGELRIVHGEACLRSLFIFTNIVCIGYGACSVQL